MTSLSWSQDVQKLAWGTVGGAAQWMDWSSRRIERTLSAPLTRAPADPSSFVAFSPDGNTLALANQEKITLWRVK